MKALPYRLDRSVVIRATRETVFRYFTDSVRWASWWGAGSTIEPVTGGLVYIRYPNGVEAQGTIVELAAPDRIAFTYGFTSGTPVPLGASLVTIALEPAPGGTRLHLSHEFSDAAARDQHVQGWRYQLSVFGNVVADEAHTGVGTTVNAWFAAWSEPDAVAREAALAGIVTPDVALRNRFSLIDGLPDLAAHIGAAQRFMPGMVLRRRGDPHHCQGTVIADWSSVATDGSDQERARGTSVFVLDEHGRISAVTSFDIPAGPS